MILLFDTETTGKADFKSDYTAAHQPRLVQLAAVVADNNLNVVHTFSTIIRPNGWVIAKEAEEVHGISTEKANDVGMDVHVALAMLNQFSKLCGTRVAHNIDFDDLIVMSEFHRLGKEWANGHVRICTMKSMTDHCKLPGPYGNKWPKLEEAFKFFTGRAMEGAHDAMADVMGCLEVYRWWVTKGKS